MSRSKLKRNAHWMPLFVGLLLSLCSCTPRYDQDFDAFRRGQSTVPGGSTTTLPSSNTTLPQSNTTLPKGSGGRTTLPWQPSTTLPQNPR